METIFRFGSPPKPSTPGSAYVRRLYLDNSLMATAPVASDSPLEYRADAGLVIRVMYNTASDEMSQLQIKLTKLHRLPPGWDGYSAPAPSERAITTAESLLSALLREDFAPRRISPSSVGGIGITHKRESRKVYVEIYNSGEVYALFSDGVSEPDIKQIEPGYQSFNQLITLMKAYLNA